MLPAFIKFLFLVDKGQKIEKINNHLNAGITFREENNLIKALEEFDSAVSLHEKYSAPPILYLERAKAHIQLGNSVIALTDLKEFTRMAKDESSLEKELVEANNIIMHLEKEK